MPRHDRPASRTARAAVLVLAGMLASGCLGAVPSPTTPRAATFEPRAATFEEFATALCSSFDSLFRAIGNPDTGESSETSKALDAAVARRDVAAAQELATEVTAELENGRRFAAVAAGWGPGAATAGHVDQLLAAYEAWTAAQVQVALGTAGVDKQQAFEQAGGVEAWRNMFESMRLVAEARRNEPPHKCPTVPVSF